MSENSQVTRLLAKRFSQPGERGRIVFWRDDKKQYADDVATLVGEHATDEVLREVELITRKSVMRTTDGTFRSPCATACSTSSRIKNSSCI